MILPPVFTTRKIQHPKPAVSPVYVDNTVAFVGAFSGLLTTRPLAHIFCVYLKCLS